MESLDFTSIAQEALAQSQRLVKEWLPNGCLEGQEWVSLNPTRSDSHPGSFKVNLDTGRWSDFASGDKGGDLIALHAYLNGLTQGKAALAVAQSLKLSRPGILKPTEPLKAKSGKGTDWTVCLPIPSDASRPEDQIKSWPHGRLPDHRWDYMDSQGRLLGYVCRWDTPEEDRPKDFRPLTLWRNQEGRLAWKFWSWTQPRPLYGLDRLASHPDLPILVVEGEKAAQAAGELLPDLVVITSPSGANSPGKADWSPLAGRRVVIWPDADAPGQAYALAVASLALTAGAVSVKLVRLPSGLPPGWDLADARSAELEQTDLARLVTEAEEFNPTKEINEEPEWEPGLSPWPVLGGEARRGLAGDFVSLATAESEADPAAVLLTYLTRFGIEVGPEQHVEVGDASQPARLFVVVVGASSKARKGTSGQAVQRLFRDLKLASTDYVSAATSPGPLSTGEGLVERVKDPVEKYVVDKKGNGGSWQVVDPGHEDKRLFVLDEELGAALNCTRREGNTLSTVLRCLFDTGTVEPLTKSNPIKCTAAHVGVVTHITLAELNKLLADTEAFSGFANRFLWCLARRSKLVPFPKPVSEPELKRLQGEVVRLVAQCRGLGSIGLSEAAKRLWAERYPNLSQAHPGLAGSVINRGETQVMRLSLIYALLDGKKSIDRPHLESALAVWDYCQASALYIFGDREADPLARKVLNILASGPNSATMIYKALGNHVTKAQLKTALAELIEVGRVCQVKEPTAGRSRVVFSLVNGEESEPSEE